MAVIALTPFFSAEAQQVAGDIQWHTDVEQAKKIAEQEKKLVLLHFGASWCRPCKALDTYVYRSSAVKKAIAENVVPVKLDADTALNMVNEYDVSMVPFDVIITPSGRVVSERRSPAEAENYAKMISGVSSASRMLAKEKMGPIAHQREIIKNSTIAGSDPLKFRNAAPMADRVALSKEGSLLQRRQDAFMEAAEGTSQKQSNPFITDRADAMESSSLREPNQLAVEDLQRNQFLGKERGNLAAPSPNSRRAEPKRIVNNRYFDSIAKKENKPASMETRSNQFSLASSQKLMSIEPASDAPGLEMPESGSNFDLDFNDDANLPMDGELSSNGGDFKIQPTTRQTTLNSVIEIEPGESTENVAPPKPVEIDREKLCLKGKCPVTLITEGSWADGDTRFGIVHRNRTYIFADAEKLKLFKSNPDNYSPILAGYDPVIYRDKGKLVDGLVENGVFMGRTPNQKVILFKDSETRGKFQMEPKKYLESIRQATDNAAKNATINR